jgi:hypothetical protein
MFPYLFLYCRFVDFKSHTVWNGSIAVNDKLEIIYISACNRTSVVQPVASHWQQKLRTTSLLMEIENRWGGVINSFFANEGDCRGSN